MGFDQKALGQRIRSLRQKCGMTQAQMATALHINIDHLGRIELGKRGISIDFLLDIAALLDVSIDFLIRGTGQQSTQSVNDLILEIRKLLDRFETQRGNST